VKKWPAVACALSTPSVSLATGEDRTVVSVSGGEGVGSLGTWCPRG
jgi:hypothetical protein